MKTIKKRVKLRLAPILVMAVALAASGAASAVPIVLQTANNAAGNQSWSGVGVHFDVNSAITVFDLGIFDSNQDGFSVGSGAPLSAYLLTGAGVVVAHQEFWGASAGTLAGNYRFKAITPVDLAVGTYVLAGYGWSGTDLEHNSNVSGLAETFNDGGGLLTYVNSPYGGGSDAAGTLPTITLGTTNYFSAANMTFDAANNQQVVPEPATLALLGLALAGLGFSRRKKA